MDLTSYRIVGTAGHIDHGKSALVRALTGIDPDRLREEKERGITIDLGFADAEIEGIHVGFIDVPGHERFVKNMLAGIGGIDAVLVVVAADESIMPQTREHLAICRLLGISRGVVAITKSDLADQEMLELVEMEIGDLLADTPLRSAPIVRTSVVDGGGLEQLRHALVSVLGSETGRPRDGLPRMPVDRVFTIRGFGTVVTGTLLSGTLRVGDRIEVLPTGRATSVRGIQVHGAAAEAAVAGQRAALNLHGVETSELERGMVLVSPGTLRATSMIDARVETLAEDGLEHLQRVRFHHGAAEVLARISLLGAAEIPPGGHGIVQLRLERPYPVAPGDRFILRRYSPITTIAGGVVIDAAARRHRRGREDAARLERLERASAAQRVADMAAGTGPAGVDRREIGPRLFLADAAVAEAIAGAAAAGLVADLPPPAPLVSRDRLNGLVTAILGHLGDYHREWPLRPAMPKEELRSRLPGPPPAALLDAVADRMREAGAIRPEADGFALAAHGPQLSQEQDARREAILSRYAEAGLAPPGTQALLEEMGPAAREVLHHLLRSGDLVRVRDDMVYHREALADLIARLRQRYSPGDRFGVGEFRDWTGVTRKHAIPLLEYLDAARVTRRVGDERERI